MSKKGPIIIIEDDADDRFFLEDALVNCGARNELKIFGDSSEALTFLSTTREQPFIILCDINMPKMTGIDLRLSINSSSVDMIKNVPFIFLSTSTSPEQIREVYKLGIQGYFVKPNSIDELRKMMATILKYWNSNQEHIARKP